MNKKIFSIILLLMFSQVFISCVSSKAAESSSSVNSLDETDDRTIDYDKVQKHIEYFSGLGSRVTGYPGSLEASQYIAKIFNNYGITVSVQKYEVAVPIDEETSITILSQDTKIKAYTLWPNSIQTSPTPLDGITGNLIYVGSGELEDFDGKNVKGSIVLMDFNSGGNWLKAANLGAKAVIFEEPESTSYLQCMEKFLETPIHFPRLYVKHDDASLLKQLSPEERINIVSRMVYKEVEAENIIGIINGTMYPDEVIIVSSHYDSWSIVPSLSPSANEAVSTAYMLELSRVIEGMHPKRTVWFVALSGHWEALAGAREFVERYYFGPEIERGTFKPLMWLNIGNLASEGHGLQLIRGGNLMLYANTQDAGGIQPRYTWVRKQIFQKYLSDSNLREAVEKLTGSDPIDYVSQFFVNNMYWGAKAFPYLLDSEPAEMAGSVSFTISTMYNHDLFIGTPLNDVGSISIKKLIPQITVITAILKGFIEEDSWGYQWRDIAPSRFSLTGSSSGGMVSTAVGFITLNGKVLTFNLTSGEYTPVPKAIVKLYVGLAYGAIFAARTQAQSILQYGIPYPFGKIITIADKDGFFSVHGIGPSPFIPGGRIFIEAWILDEKTGRIQYAPDFGIYGAGYIEPVVSPLGHPVNASIVISKLNPVTIFDVMDPRTGRTTIIPDTRLAGWYCGTVGGGWFYIDGGMLIPYDTDTKSELLSYGAYYNGWDPVAMVFIPQGVKFTVTLTPSGLSMPSSGRPIMVLTNSSEEFPEGSGFIANGGTMVTFTAYRTAEDMFMMAKSRYETLKSHNVRSLSLEEYLTRADEYLASAEESYRNMSYSKAYRLSLNAWINSYKAYEETMALIEDASKSVMFFFALILFSALFIERLTLHKEGKARLGSVILVSAILLFIFSWVHPALALSSMSLLSLFGTLGLMLFLFTFSIIALETEEIMEKVSVSLLGRHRMKMSRIEIITSAFPTSIENMRRRRLRTILTLITIISTSITLTSLTSLSYYTTVHSVALPSKANYDGLLLKITENKPPNLQPYLIEYVRGVVENALVFPRVWYYPPAINDIGVSSPIYSEKNYTIINAALGITPEESNAMFTSGSLIGIGFMKGFYNTCIITDATANTLMINVGDQLEAFGLNLTVVGIMFPEMLEDNYDLDGFQPAPINPYALSIISLGEAGQQIPVIPLQWDQVIIIPYELALDLGGHVASVSIRFEDNVETEDFMKYSREIASCIDTKIYVGWHGAVYQTSRIPTLISGGWEIVSVLLIIGALNISTALLGSVKEREKEIFIYSSLGLSPLGGTILFVVESLTYAFIGSVLGYFIGFAMNYTFIRTNLLPPNFLFNYAAIYSIISLSSIIIAALASSIYPARVSSKIITPSLTRKWKPPTKPRGDEWVIPLPTRIPLEDSLGLLEYLREYYTGEGSEKTAFIIRKVVPSSFEDLSMELIVDLRPIEQGISQKVTIRAYQDKPEVDMYYFSVEIKKLRGVASTWRLRCYEFVDDLRKQILLWRSLSQEERLKYTKTNKSKS